MNARFPNTYCSQCGRDLGPGDEGVSHCSDHARHTPAPWRFLEEGRSEEEPNYCKPLTICGPDDDDLANIYSSDDSTVSITRSEAIANARLMAAAPELRDSLAWALRRIRASKLDEGDHFARAESALAKADKGVKPVSDSSMLWAEAFLASPRD